MVHFRSSKFGLTLADRRVILLDLEADRYFGFAERVEAALRAQIESFPATVATCSPALIVGARTFTAVEDTQPAASLLDQALPPASARMLALAVAARVYTAAQFRRRPLLDVLSGLATRKGKLLSPKMASAAIDDAKLSALIAGFQASERLVSGTDRCLSLSVALADTLLRRGITVDLVIGVSGAPFAAHAWVQRGSTLLADQVDRVRRFSPVFSI